MSRAMLLTGSGGAAIAVVRIEGERVPDFLRECFDRPVREGACVYGRIKDGERILDDVVVLLQDAHADLNLHGGIWIIHEVLQLLALRGFQVVNWSSEQTWGSDGETELDREISAYLPLGRSALAIGILLNQREAWEGIANAPNDVLEKILRDRTLEFLLYPPSIAIVGLPNVGKSTLANQLFGQERSITADMPGTTRDWVGEWANIDGLVVKLIDTPGQRSTDDAIETRAITAAHTVIAAAELVVVVIDPMQDADAQNALLERFPAAVVVINKSDLANWPGAGVRTVASRGIGMDVLRSQIRDCFGVLYLDENQPRCWTQRQREQITEMLRAKSARPG